MNLDLEEFKSVVTESQHCQRNWDLTQSVPMEHIQFFQHIVEQCPTKQNRVFYKVKFITNRDLITSIYNTTDSFWNYDDSCLIENAQTLANLLVVFIEDKDHMRENRTLDEYTSMDEDGNFAVDIVDSSKAVGVCAGFLNLAARMLGYQTGHYDARHNPDELAEIIGGRPMHAIGIGFADTAKDHNRHQFQEYSYDTYTKEVKSEIIT